MKRRLFFVLILLLVLTPVSFFYMKFNNIGIKAQENTSNKQENKTNTEDLIVTPQNPTNKVTVESVTLKKDGFAVVRQMDDGKLSQVIEMSQPLKVGTHKNIPISLGSADITNKELIVMIYEDYADDGVFNDLDMPALNENGFMTARFVKTGEPLPANITEGESTGGMMGMNMPGMKAMEKVRYTDKGFTPNKTEVPVGSMVEFINDSSMDMWVASVPHPQHSKLPTFDQFRLYKKGATYRYVFDKKGTWEYHDHINPTAGGVVTVN